jgi:hypothetical protein
VTLLCLSIQGLAGHDHFQYFERSMVDQGCAQAKKTLKFFIVGCSILNLKVLKLYPGQRRLHDTDEHQHIVIRFFTF